MEEEVKKLTLQLVRSFSHVAGISVSPSQLAVQLRGIYAKTQSVHCVISVREAK